VVKILNFWLIWLSSNSKLNLANQSTFYGVATTPKTYVAQLLYEIKI